MSASLRAARGTPTFVLSSRHPHAVEAERDAERQLYLGDRVRGHVARVEDLELGLVRASVIDVGEEVPFVLGARFRGGDEESFVGLECRVDGVHRRGFRLAIPLHYAADAVRMD